jgi:hypothetical protein
MVSSRSFPVEFQNLPLSRSTPLGCDNVRLVYERLYLRSRSRCSDQRRAAGNELQLIAGPAVGCSREFSRLTNVTI